MKHRIFPVVAVLVALAFNSCGGGKAAPMPTKSSPVTTATLTAFATTLGKTAPAAPSTMVTAIVATATPGATNGGQLEVSGGVPGGAARATIHTTPGITCSIVYTHPSGKISTASGLTSKVAGADGVASWTWLVDRTTKAGNGTVAVTCGTDKTSAPIAIGASN